LISIGQALMKVGFKQSTIPSDIEFSIEFIKSFVASLFATPWIFTGYFFATISSILFLEALHNTEFGITTAVFRLNYIVAYFIGVIYFGETFKYVNLIGIMLIFIGVLFISLSEDKKA
jgi:drug/metabolite transporter (DMT)-like permease